MYEFAEGWANPYSLTAESPAHKLLFGNLCAAPFDKGALVGATNQSSTGNAVPGVPRYALG